MTAPRPTAALLRLREALGLREDAAVAPRVLRHRGTCGDTSVEANVQANTEANAEAVDFGVLGVPVVDAACDGACWAAPAATVVRPGHRHRFAHVGSMPRLDELAACLRGECDERQAGSGESGLTARLGRNDGSLPDVLAQGGYSAAALAAILSPARVVEVAAGAGLAVRDGRGILAAPEWERAAAEGARVLVVDAGGGPGDVRDRHLLEGDPHRIVEGILVVCRAAGIAEVHARIAGEPRGFEAFEHALVDATASGILAGDALGGDPVAVHLHAGAGPAVAGASLTHDLETLCAATAIFDTPPPPTKLVALSGDLARRGLIEVPVDGNTTWAGLLTMAGVAPARVQALRVDGPPGRLVRPTVFDSLLTMPALGAGAVEVLGPGAVIEGAEA